MDIIISNSSGEPIYEQIITQIKNQIISEKLKEGDNLPSMRTLAKNLKISVITTKRAYEELEREGFITTVTGKGSFVASKNIEFIKESQLCKIESLLTEAVKISDSCGISLEELQNILNIIYNND